MSHVSTIKVKVKDLEALKRAAGRLGMQFNEGKQTFRSYAGQNKCQHSISHPAASYEVGVIPKADGTHEIAYDGWQRGGLGDVLGRNAERLMQAYGVEEAQAILAAQGLTMSESTLQDGTVRTVAYIYE